MARERILVKDAMYRVKNVIRSFLTPLSSSNEDSESITKIDINVLSFSLRFLSETKKLHDLLTDLASILHTFQSQMISDFKTITVIGIEDEEFQLKSKELSGAWVNPLLIEGYLRDKKPTLEIDEFYDLVLYPTARIIESLAVYKFYHKIEGIDEKIADSIENGLNFLLKAISKLSLDNICYDISMCVPIAKALDKAAYHIDFDNEIKGIILSLRTLTKELDPDMELIYSQDVYYSALRSEFVNNGSNIKIDEKELIPLYNNLHSNIYGKILKGIEFLTTFRAPLPIFVNDKLLPMTSKYFKAIFKVANGTNFLKYYSNLAESTYHILLNSNNRAFAESVLNLLTESSSWIYNKAFNTRELVKIVLGSGLLVLARGALRR